LALGREGEPVIKHRSCCVLCIGDDLVHLNLRCAALRAHGWRVLSSANGYEGVLRFGQEKVDVVVVDLNDGGTEFALIAGELKRLRPKVPVVMLVADKAALTQGASDQADAVVVKSEEMRSLIDVVESLLKAS
jgi:CheY-like chemotaxis protein